MPSDCSVMARSPAVTCSPDATTASYSRASCSGEASLAQPTSSLVLPDIAETTTATSWPASTSRLTWRATLRMRSILATDVPPNFMTSRAMRRGAILLKSRVNARVMQRRWARHGRRKAAIHTHRVPPLQPRRETF